jgi:hypothetical protein
MAAHPDIAAVFLSVNLLNLQGRHNFAELGKLRPNQVNAIFDEIRVEERERVAQRLTEQQDQDPALIEMVRKILRDEALPETFFAVTDVPALRLPSTLDEGFMATLDYSAPFARLLLKVDKSADEAALRAARDARLAEGLNLNVAEKLFRVLWAERERGRATELKLV